jgi:hypothetical protein
MKRAIASMTVSVRVRTRRAASSTSAMAATLRWTVSAASDGRVGGA